MGIWFCDFSLTVPSSPRGGAVLDDDAEWL